MARCKSSYGDLVHSKGLDGAVKLGDSKFWDNQYSKDDYKKTEMYKIICNNPEVTFTYVGHTTNFTVRKACHKSACTGTELRIITLQVDCVIIH